MTYFFQGKVVTLGCVNLAVARVHWNSSKTDAWKALTEQEREQAIHDDVFNPVETDVEYFQRRCKELGMSDKLPSFLK
jgi:hypothetical protein